MVAPVVNPAAGGMQRLDKGGLSQPVEAPKVSSRVAIGVGSKSVQRWALLDVLRGVTGRKSHRMCARYTVDGDAEIGTRAGTKLVKGKDGKRRRVADGDRASVSNVIMCDSTLCPVCCARKRASQLRAVEASTEGIDQVALMTLTVPHDRKTPLADMLDAMATAWNASMSARQRRAWEAVGMVGWLKALDYTHGQNGHHPHYHAVLYFDRHVSEETLTEVFSDTFDRWSRSIERSLGRAPTKTAQDIQHARDRDDVRRYAIKAFSMDALWVESKDRGGDTMWEVLKQAPESTRHRAVWSEIETATYRRRWATAGGIVSLKEPETDEADEAEEDEEVEPVLTVPRPVWAWLVGKRLIPRVLWAVENRREDPAKLDQWRALFIVAEARLRDQWERRNGLRTGPPLASWVPRLPE